MFTTFRYILSKCKKKEIKTVMLPVLNCELVFFYIILLIMSKNVEILISLILVINKGFYLVATDSPLLQCEEYLNLINKHFECCHIIIREFMCLIFYL